MINQLLNELEQLQKKEFKEEWKELGRQLIIEDLQIKLIRTIKKELVKNADLLNGKSAHPNGGANEFHFFDNFKGK